MSIPVQLDNDELALQAYFRAEDMTDGLPIIVPTRDRLERFIAHSGFAMHRGFVIGGIPPLNAPVTIEDVAVVCLMAGARSQDLGVVLAAIEAMLDPAFTLPRVQATTNPCAPVLFINGPVVRELGIGSSNHALGPGRHPNGAIGRSIRLALRNLGGATDDVDHASLGQPAKYTCCLGEAEDRSPWEPYHVSRGFRPEQSVVTVAGIENIVNVVTTTGRHVEMAAPFIYQFGRLMQCIGTNIYDSNGSPVIVITPGQAKRLAEEGYDRQRLQKELYAAAQIPLEVMKYGNFPVCKWSVRDGKILPCQGADDIRIFVAGGDEALHSVYMNSFTAVIACSREVWTPKRFQ